MTMHASEGMDESIIAVLYNATTCYAITNIFRITKALAVPQLALLRTHNQMCARTALVLKCSKTYLQNDMKLEGVSRDPPGGASARASSH